MGYYLFMKKDSKHNRLTAIKETRKSYGGRITYWLFKCDCGEVKEYSKYAVLHGKIKSCGCLRREETIKRSTKHNDASRQNRSRLNKIWADMKKRCSSSRYKKLLRQRHKGL